MQRTITLVVALVAAAALSSAGDVIFTDGWESGSPCSWASEFAACGVGTEMVITLPGDAVTMTLMYVPPGTFWMGSPEDERGRTGYEDLHEVTLTHGFWLGTTEVTQAQWEAVMGTLPDLACSDGLTYGVGPSFPVYCVSWELIAGTGGFVETLDAYLATTAQPTGFRLPTDAEWERAARAGNQYRFSHGDVLECDDSCVVCPTHSTYMWWCGDKPTATAQPVRTRQANGFGLFDMHGNVYELVQDWWQTQLGESPVTDPTGPTSGLDRVMRGGHWALWAQFCRSAYRNHYAPASGNGGIGFRLTMTAN